MRNPADKKENGDPPGIHARIFMDDRKKAHARGNEKEHKGTTGIDTILET